MSGEARRTLAARSGARPQFKSASAAARRRGRPKNECIDVEVVAAVLDRLRSRGYRGVTMEGVARQVKRARTSLYRRWPSKRHLVADAVVAELGAQPAPDTGSLRKDLKAAVGTLLSGFAGPLGKALPGLVADMALDPALGTPHPCGALGREPPMGAAGVLLTFDFIKTLCHIVTPLNPASPPPSRCFRQHI